MSKLFNLSGALAAALMIASGAQALELRLSVETPPGHVRNQAAEQWAAAIAELSGGDITVEVFPAGQLYNSADAIRALASGALDLSIQASPTLSRLEPNLSVITLPMFFGATRDDIRAVLDGPLGAELWGMVAQRGIVVPEGGHFEFAPNNTAYTTEPAASYEELAGRTVATPPSPVVVQIMSAMGINGVATPRTEIVLQLTQGQIQGLGSVTDLTISGGRLWEAGIRHAFNDNAGWGVYIPLASARTLDAMTEEQRGVINQAWAQVVGWARDASAEELEHARATNEENGITYADPSDEMIGAMRAQMMDLQPGIVEASGMDADFVGRVAAALHSQ
ncbi:TRAP transporter substrate-binding protein DctP [Pararhodobacter zhoushanensis]|uniref:TRAP transporter substrate-binding protein DctP n=1 Tax=Pararhodobacter zhoushanensis TaxID=2479545 RepID=A0ABT3GZB6_9RHOB|nr:TRAP transporter substrate-binding protein DctP [Pararhodobacter zhoushanensis]MCW1932871.1 TRAP transporter substrate-binding protein DctP [Pararhodobacter zhoushanensis]